MTADHRLRIGLTQWHATTDIDANLAVAERLTEQAASDGATLVALPENGLMLGTNAQMRSAAFTEDGPAVTRLRETAARLGVAVILGGLKNRTDRGVFNSALIIAPDGTLAGRYDKLHLFDANIDGQSFEASSVEQPGTDLVVIEVDGV
ncbi:MAG: carbon-nitrogen hydrolase, partial [Aldersonia sp.]|nr:carbon-nitrogen hydrolase [Aldersonia sp.]